MSLRNIAIIAHVDHGKTTLVDQLLAQSGAVESHRNVAERAMDSNDLEKERGITILAKVTSVMWKDTRINIIDTPGHADFGGEVERILGMVDGVVLLVDAAEGPMPQTKFVTMKALGLGLRPIVVVNKVDRSDGTPDETLDAVFELFSSLDATSEQLDFPILYASGRAGWSVKNLTDERTDLSSLFETIVEHVPVPSVAAEDNEPFALNVRVIQSDPFMGRLLIGRVEAGTLKINSTIKALNRTGELVQRARVTKILAFRGLERVPVESCKAGDIVALAGFSEATVADTLCDESVNVPLHTRPVDPPTIAVTFGINDSPFAGKEGDKVQSRVIRDRLMQETEGNVAIRVTETESKDAFEVAGRGELQLGVLIETMRREGFELSISRPRVLFKQCPETGQTLEPLEEITIDVDDSYSGVVIEKLSLRKAELQDMRPSGHAKTRLVMLCPSRGLIGYAGEFLTDTRGTGILNRVFHSYTPHKGPIEGRRNGVLISMADGQTTSYALQPLESRGVLFVSPTTNVYTGMIIGEHNRDNDLDVNPLKAKQLTNFRAAGKDDAVRLTPPRALTLEQAISYIASDEVAEITPKNIRLRKKILNPGSRKSNRDHDAA